MDNRATVHHNRRCLIVALWTIASDRRKAVDRLVRTMELREMLIADEDDAAGRVIARIAKRVTKGE